MKTQQEREQAFVEEVRKTLQEKGEKLDPEILARLASIRSGVVEDRGSKFSGLWRLVRYPAAAFMVGTLAMALFIFASLPPTSVRQTFADFEDVEILIAAEEPDFFAELDFYQWLAEQPDV